MWSFSRLFSEHRTIIGIDDKLLLQVFWMIFLLPNKRSYIFSVYDEPLCIQRNNHGILYMIFQNWFLYIFSCDYVHSIFSGLWATVTSSLFAFSNDFFKFWWKLTEENNFGKFLESILTIFFLKCREMVYCMIRGESKRSSNDGDNYQSRSVAASPVTQEFGYAFPTNYTYNFFFNRWFIFKTLIKEYFNQDLINISWSRISLWTCFFYFFHNNSIKIEMTTILSFISFHL